VTIQPEAVPFRALTKEQAIYEQLKNSIVSGRLEPGLRLIPAEIGAQFQVSTMPVRNALMRLEAEHLVSRSPHREYAVARYSRKEIREVYDVRIVLEGFAARLAAENISPEGLRDLAEILRRSEQHLDEGKGDLFKEANGEFHTAVCRHSGNDQLAETIQALRDKSTRFRATYYRQWKPPRMALQEHHEILSALERGKPDEAEAWIKKDVGSARDLLLQWTD
jgi:DNA-binding GntR family transcriptional regulator